MSSTNTEEEKSEEEKPEEPKIIDLDAIFESSESEEDTDHSDSDDDYPTSGAAGEGYISNSDDENDNSPEATVRKFTRALESRSLKKKEEREERKHVYPEDLFNFPKDPENWREEDLRELWADGPIESNKTGWDPVWADEEDWEIVQEEIDAGRDPPIAPFYLPYRKYYPVIPDNHHDISNPKSVIEELDRIEEFLKWVSYIFPDGSSYEGTVWDDLAHGKGVYVAEQGLVRYEGEWLRNEMEGHGVVEVDIPDVQPVPGSTLEAKMRAEGRIITRDFMTPEDKKWLEMDIEDSVRLAGNLREIPFYEREAWVKIFGQKPERGRYKYAGQWKHGRMHGCGVYEVNERITYGRFYFGEHLEDSIGCDSDVSALHAGIAEVAAAKARMFVNKPDGMVREERGPYGDPQHPYFYEEDDVWMAPGFINQFHEVPDYWKTYVEEVDQEREMWLNSFYKAPLRLPMPAELEHWWSKDQGPEFVLINKEPEPDPEDPSSLVYTEDPLIMHVPTGRLINFIEDEEHGIRLFWQPELKEGEEIDKANIEFLPLGYDEFFGKAEPSEPKQGKLMSMITSLENKLRPVFEKLEKWVEQKKKDSEMNQKLIEKELEFIEAEICLEEALEDMDNALKMKQKEEEKRSAAEKDGDKASNDAGEDEADSDDEEDEDEDAPSSFGTVGQDDKSDKSSFSSLTMSLASYTPASLIPWKLQRSLKSSKKRIAPTFDPSSLFKNEKPPPVQENVCFVKFPKSTITGLNLEAMVQRKHGHSRKRNKYHPHLQPLALLLSKQQMFNNSEEVLCTEYLSILSLHVPLPEIAV